MKEDEYLPNKEQNCCPGTLPECGALAMAYVPIQQFNTTYSPEVAILKGTVFPDLDKPFCGRTIEGGGCRRA